MRDIVKEFIFASPISRGVCVLVTSITSKGRTSSGWAPISAIMLLALSPFVAIVPATYAQSATSITTSDGSSVCPARPLSGIWNGTTDTCTVWGTVSINSTTTLDIGAGVNVTGSSSGAYGIDNSGIINNDGTITGSGTGTDGTGIYNSGTINNAGTMAGSGTSFGILNDGGRINNDGVMSGAGGPSGAAIDNIDTGDINDYCGVTPSEPVSNMGAFNTVFCYTVTFEQTGLPASGVTWGVNASWGPFDSIDHTGTGTSITINATLSLTYSYDLSVTVSGTAYDCSTGCSGTIFVSRPSTLSASYSPAASSKTNASTSASASSTKGSSGIPEFPFDLLILTVFTVLVPLSYVLVRRRRRTQ